MSDFKTRVWEVQAYGWGADVDEHTASSGRQAFLNRYFPGRLCLSPGLDGCRFSATEEEVAFCEFDCGAIIKEVLWLSSSY